MQTLRKSYRGLSLLIDLNSDRIYSLSALAVALLLGAWIMATLAQSPLGAVI